MLFIKELKPTLNKQMEEDSSNFKTGDPIIFGYPISSVP